jgi:hypothetical protein
VSLSSLEFSDFFVSWFVQAMNDADTSKHNNSFFIGFGLEIGFSLFQ